VHVEGLFDNVLICDDEEYAEKFGEETWGATKGPEKEMKDAVSSYIHTSFTWWQTYIQT
jgi:hypothetical protein